MVRRLSIWEKQPSDLLLSCDQPSNYKLVLEVIGCMRIVLLPNSQQTNQIRSDLWQPYEAYADMQNAML